MFKVARDSGTTSATPWLCLLVILASATCAGPDHLTDPIISVGGASTVSVGGTTGISSSTQTVGGGPAVGTIGGGTVAGSTSTASGGATTGGNSTAGTAVTFAWGSIAYDARKGATVGYQNHFTGTACFAACHAHVFTAGGTVYSSGGTTTAANAEVGILANGTVTTTYSGSQGNFYVTVPGTVNWATAQIAIRTATGSRTMPANSAATGSCNSCHSAGNRIVVP